jgi:hypothetical protein
VRGLVSAVLLVTCLAAAAGGHEQRHWDKREGVRVDLKRTKLDHSRKWISGSLVVYGRIRKSELRDREGILSVNVWRSKQEGFYSAVIWWNTSTDDWMLKLYRFEDKDDPTGEVIGGGRATTGGRADAVFYEFRRNKIGMTGRTALRWTSSAFWCKNEDCSRAGSDFLPNGGHYVKHFMSAKN